ncbi:MAG: MATE family efflux transporter [Firmicutes bacterium]|nr:MATE family efflux transporter [Bacillota bacterium]
MDSALTKSQKKVFFQLSWPLLMEVFLGLFTGYLITLMLANYSDTAAGLVSIVNQMISLFYLVFMIVSTGTGILMAQSVGAKSSLIKEKIAAVSIFYAGIIGLLGTILIVLFGQGILTVLNLDPTMIHFGTNFAMIIGAFFFMQSISFVVAQIVYSYGHTKIGMIGTFVANIATLIVDWALIFGVPSLGIPSLGVIGAAIGSVVGRLIYFAFIYVFLRKKIKITLSAKTLKPFPKDVAVKLFKVGFPATAENISYVLAQLVITGFVVALGANAIASKAYFDSIAVATYVVSSAIAGSSAILVGQMIGAQDKVGAEKIVRYTLKVSFITSVIPSIALVFLAGPLGHLFTSDPNIIAAMQVIALLDVVLEVARSINLILYRNLKATGDARYPLYLGLVVNWIVMLPVAYFFCFTLGWGLMGIWIALATDEVVRAIFMVLRWKSRRWETKTLIKEAPPIDTDRLSL